MNLSTSAERQAVRDLIVARDGQNCHVCTGVINLTLSPTHDYGPTIDHVLPIRNGGTSDLWNLKLAHKTCNDQRGHITSDAADSWHRKGWAQIGAIHGWNCVHCERTCDPAVTERAIVSVKQRGNGKDVLANLRLAHVECESVAHPPREMVNELNTNNPPLWIKRVRGHMKARTANYRRHRSWRPYHPVTRTKSKTMSLLFSSPFDATCSCASVIVFPAPTIPRLGCIATCWPRYAASSSG